MIMNSYQNNAYSLVNEITRLQSFQNWPIPHIVAPENLAKAGFYYLKQDDKTRCPFCKGIVEKWEVGDDPDKEHKRHFPYCPFVQTVIEPRLERLGAENINLGPNVSFDTPNQDELGINLHRGPYQTDYITLESRLRTFSAWPKALVQTPKMLAEAGFYYQGYGDAVQCFSCGGGFKDWDPQDDPWTEHARWFPKCNYVSLVKGHEFVRKCKVAASGNNSKDTVLHETLNGIRESNNIDDRLEIPSKQGSSLEGSAANDSNDTISSPETLLPTDEVNRLLKKSRLCKICMTEEIGVVFLPCGHLAVCVNCAPSLKDCPICRSSIKGTVRTFLS